MWPPLERTKKKQTEANRVVQVLRPNKQVLRPNKQVLPPDVNVHQVRGFYHITQRFSKVLVGNAWYYRKHNRSLMKRRKSIMQKVNEQLSNVGVVQEKESDHDLEELTEEEKNDEITVETVESLIFDF
eukprot:GHVP01046965.1.p1 GENE.GHVP01046965.1~~GHVP01046965.1.p1  ORF type:complete len:128 (-),score=16.57 GHVP01046965.1:58-441(-)